MGVWDQEIVPQRPDEVMDSMVGTLRVIYPADDPLDPLPGTEGGEPIWSPVFVGAGQPKTGAACWQADIRKICSAVLSVAINGAPSNVSFWK